MGYYLLTGGGGGVSPGADGTTLMSASAATLWVPPGPAPFFENTAVYVNGDTVFLSGATGSSSAQGLFLYPKYVSRPITLAGLSCSVTTLEAGATARLGYYALNDDWSSGTLVTEYTSGGAVDCSTTGVKTAAGSDVVAPGWYLLAVWCSNRTTVRFSKAAGFNPGIMGHPTGSLNRYCFAFKVTADYSAGLPATVSGWSLMNTVANTEAIWVGMAT